MITSKSNDFIKFCLQIKDKKYSREYSKCLVESIKLVRELSQKGLVETILVVESKFDSVKEFNCKKIEKISLVIADLLAETITTDGVFAVCKIPESSVSDYSRCLILDRIQDPSNLGAILRSACAFGFRTILAINSVYPYTGKVIRSSMGQIFNVNYCELTYENLLKVKEQQNMHFVVADMDGIDVSKFDKSSANRLGLVIGNEGAGVSKELCNAADNVISIPMTDGVESLNASVSAGILMYILK